MRCIVLRPGLTAFRLPGILATASRVACCDFGQTQASDFVNFLNSLSQFDLRIVLHSPAKGIENFVAIAAFHCHDKRKSELVLVSLVHVLEQAEFLGRALIDSRVRLFRRGVRRQSATDGRTARQVGMRVDEFQSKFMHASPARARWVGISDGAARTATAWPPRSAISSTTPTHTLMTCPTGTWLTASRS